MKVYLGKDRQDANQHMTVMHVNVQNLTRWVVRVGCKLYMDKCLSSSDLYDDLQTKKINCYGSVRPKWKGMMCDCGCQKLRLKKETYMLRCRLTWWPWFDKTKETFLWWQIYTNHQKIEITVMSIEMLLKPAIIEENGNMDF